MKFQPQHGAIAQLSHHHDLQLGQLSGYHIQSAFHITIQNPCCSGTLFLGMKCELFVFVFGRTIAYASMFIKSDLTPGVQAM